MSLIDLGLFVRIGLLNTLAIPGDDACVARAASSCG
jgi:hypothetical protein